MGIYDREYYRREGSSFLGSLAERGYICKWLVGINVVLFVLQLLAQDPHTGYNSVTDALVLNAQGIKHGEVWRLLTAAFVHSTASPMHILFNMLFLWWFGSDVEDLYGRKEFLAVYLTGALLGNVVWLLFNLDSGLSALGASGAVMTVVVLSALHYPTRVILLFFILPVPIWVFVAFIVAKDAFSFLGRTPDGVAVKAHLAGAAFGFLYYKFQWRLTNLLPGLKGWKRSLSRPRLRIHRDEESRPAPAAVPAASAPAPALEDEQLEAKMDAVLEKISREGKDNLTESEREVLRRASEIYRRRRR